MAEPDIKIKIATTADTAGIKQTDDALRKLNGTVNVSTVGGFLDGPQGLAGKARVAEFAFYDLDKAVSKTGNSGGKLEPLVAQIRRIPAAVAPAVDGVKNLDRFATQAGFQLTDFAVQVQGGTSALTAFSQQFPQLIGSVQQSGLEISKVQGGLANLPIGIATSFSIGAIAIGVGVTLVVTAYKEMEKAQKALIARNTEIAEQEQFMFAERAKMLDKERQGFITKFYKDQTDELQKQVQALERINELRAAQGGTAQAAADAAVAAAQRSGGNVIAAQGNALATGVDNQVDELQGKLAASRQVMEQAVVDLATATALLAEQRSYGDEFSDDYKAADAAYQLALQAKTEATADLQTKDALYAEALKTQQINTAAAFDGLAKEAAADQTKKAQDTLATLQAKATEANGDISSSMQQAISDLSKALADGVVKANESPLVADAVNQMRASREGADGKILAAITSLASTADTVNQVLPGLLSRISAIEQAARAWQGTANGSF